MTQGWIVNITVVALLVIGAISKGAHAADNAMITLSCDGKLTTMGSSNDPEPISKMGVVLNLAEHTVAFGEYVVGISQVNAANVKFSGDAVMFLHGTRVGTVSIDGDLDRATGALQAMQTSKALSYSFDLFCKPANRLF